MCFDSFSEEEFEQRLLDVGQRSCTQSRCSAFCQRFQFYNSAKSRLHRSMVAFPILPPAHSSRQIGSKDIAIGTPISIQLNGMLNDTQCTQFRANSYSFVAFASTCVDRMREFDSVPPHELRFVEAKLYPRLIVVSVQMWLTSDEIKEMQNIRQRTTGIDEESVDFGRVDAIDMPELEASSYENEKGEFADFEWLSEPLAQVKFCHTAIGDYGISAKYKGEAINPSEIPSCCEITIYSNGVRREVTMPLALQGLNVQSGNVVFKRR